MTIVVNDGRIQYVAVGGELTFDYDFKIFDAAHLQVIRTDADGTDVVLLDGIDYTTAGVGDGSGGTITLTTAAVVAELYTLSHAITNDRATDFTQKGDFSAAAINNELDRLVQMQRVNTRDMSRALRMNPADIMQTLDPFPKKADRTGKVLAFNSEGQPIAQPPVQGTVGVGTPLVTGAFAGDGSTVTFDMGFSVQTASEVHIALDGFTQQANVDYTITGNNITFTSAPPRNTVIYFHTLAPGVGAPGPSTIWRSGSGAPSAGLGNIDDMYLDIDNGDIYHKTGGTWTFLLSLTEDAKYNPNTVLAADINDTPTARVIAEQQILGRITAGNIKGLTVAEVKTLLAFTASDFELDRIAGSTFSTVQELQDVFHSAGWTSDEGGITDNGDGTIDVAAGTGAIRVSNSATANLKWFDWAGVTNQALADNDWSWVFVALNGGSPIVTISTTEPTESHTVVLLAEIRREGTTLTITESVRHLIGDHANQMILRLKALGPFARVSGAIVTEPASLKVGVSAGVFWNGLTAFPTSVFNTNASDTFTYWHRNGSGGWTPTTAQTDIDNTQYDDGDGTLGTINNGRYGTHYPFITEAGMIHTVYGRGQAFTLTDALNDTVPSDLPPVLSEPTSARLIAQIVIQKSASTFQVQSAFTSPIDFAGSGIQSVQDDGSPTLGGTLDTNGFAVQGVPVVVETDTTLTLDATHDGKVITLNNGSAIAVTAPNSLGVGWHALLIQLGAGQVTVTAGSGATVNNIDTQTKIEGANGAIAMVVYANSGGSSAVYNLSGRTAA